MGWGHTTSKPNSKSYCYKNEQILLHIWSTPDSFWSRLEFWEYTFCSYTYWPLAFGNPIPLFTTHKVMVWWSILIGSCSSYSDHVSPHKVTGKHLPYVLYTYRISCHSTTGVCPYLLLYDRDLPTYQPTKQVAYDSLSYPAQIQARLAELQDLFVLT